MCKKKLDNYELKELEEEYKVFSAGLEPVERERVIPLYEWMLLTQYAMQGHAYTVKAINDAYRLGVQNGKRSWHKSISMIRIVYYKF